EEREYIGVIRHIFSVLTDRRSHGDVDIAAHNRTAARGSGGDYGDVRPDGDADAGVCVVGQQEVDVATVGCDCRGVVDGQSAGAYIHIATGGCDAAQTQAAVGGGHCE